jgi:transketolase
MVSPHASSYAIRKLILERSKQANVGHIGSALSIADIMAALFDSHLHKLGTADPLRDRLVLSKGHAALALYAALHLTGIIDKDELGSYCCDGSLCGVHPEHKLAGIDFSTGSLGHGLAFGAGAALAARMQNSPSWSYVLVSDAECNEGSLWETVMFAAHHKLFNLVAIVDDNGQQALGKTQDVIDLSPLADKWRAFGWTAREVDGHDVARLKETLAELRSDRRGPKVVIAKTVCGKGVSFMEGQVAWHYLPLSDDQFRTALHELEEQPRA